MNLMPFYFCFFICTDHIGTHKIAIFLFLAQENNQGFVKPQTIIAETLIFPYFSTQKNSSFYKLTLKICMHAIFS